MLNIDEGESIYLTEVTSRIDDIQIYGTMNTPAFLNLALGKTHKGKGAVSYYTDDGFWMETRGDISSLRDFRKSTIYGSSR
ncbi:MAG: hypothetical protein LBU32_06520 [Clostridiales bacterium]|nr:hypothetical protein [Clostridiales bacterium]